MCRIDLFTIMHETVDITVPFPKQIIQQACTNV